MGDYGTFKIRWNLCLAGGSFRHAGAGRVESNGDIVFNGSACKSSKLEVRVRIPLSPPTRASVLAVLSRSFRISPAYDKANMAQWRNWYTHLT